MEDLDSKYNLGQPKAPKCLLMTALNSIKQSLLKGLRDTGLQAEALTSENAREVVKSREIKIILVSPEA